MSTRGGKVASRVPGAPAEKSSGRGRRSSAPTSGTIVTVQTYFADEMALLAATERRKVDGPKKCDVCEARLHSDDDGAGGSGLFVWARGEELRVEEPQLCERCAGTIGVVMNHTLDVDDEEG